MRPPAYYVLPATVLLAGFTLAWAHDAHGRSTSPPEARHLKSPVPVSTANLESGAKLYIARCAGCHGEDGKARTPLVIRTMVGAGRSAAAQHSQSLYHLFTAIPGLKVVVPSNAYDAKGLLIQAIRDDDPVVFCEHKLMYDLKADVPDEAYTIPFGEAAIVRDGGDVTIVALARMVHYAAQAAETLAAEGIDCEIIDPRTTSPLDEDTILESVARTGRLVVVDEATPRCNMATDIAALVADRAFRALKAPVRRVTAPHTPVPFAPSLERLYIPDPERIAAAVRSVWSYSA